MLESAPRSDLFASMASIRANPYQANLYGLPKKVIEECLKGLC